MVAGKCQTCKRHNSWWRAAAYRMTPDFWWARSELSGGLWTWEYKKLMELPPKYRNGQEFPITFLYFGANLSFSYILDPAAEKHTRITAWAPASRWAPSHNSESNDCLKKATKIYTFSKIWDYPVCRPRCSASIQGTCQSIVPNFDSPSALADDYQPS